MYCMSPISSKEKTSYTTASETSTKPLSTMKYQKKKSFKGRESKTPRVTQGGLRLMPPPKPRSNSVSIRRTGPVRPELGW